jgi:hypothetical protein
MKADELEMRRKQMELFQRQQTPNRLEAPASNMPPWADNQSSDMR